MATTVPLRSAVPTFMWLAALLALLFVSATPTFASDYDSDVDVSTFYDELDDDGDWIEHPKYGYVWTPSVDREWRPYTVGHWSNTEEHGWYWESEEPFGWAVYHYGRWGFDDDLGWYWVPGRKWGPAWVDWRNSDNEIGWRPLGPDEDWDSSGGVRIQASYYDAPSYAPRWVFVSPRYFAEPALRIHLFPRTQSVVYLGRTQRITTYTVVNRRVVNRGITINFVQRYAPRPVVTRRITVTDTRVVRRPGSTTTVINVYRPKALRTTTTTTTTTTTVRLTKPKKVVNKTVVVEKKRKIQPANFNAGGTPTTRATVKQGPIGGADNNLTPKQKKALKKANKQATTGANAPPPTSTKPFVAKTTPPPQNGATGPKPSKQGKGGQNANQKQKKQAAQAQGGQQHKPGQPGATNANQNQDPNKPKKKKKNQQNQPNQP